jgi:hypothetical protein
VKPTLEEMRLVRDKVENDKLSPESAIELMDCLDDDNVAILWEHLFDVNWEIRDVIFYKHQELFTTEQARLITEYSIENPDPKAFDAYCRMTAILGTVIIRGQTDPLLIHRLPKLVAIWKKNIPAKVFDLMLERSAKGNPDYMRINNECA